MKRIAIPEASPETGIVREAVEQRATLAMLVRATLGRWFTATAAMES